LNKIRRENPALQEYANIEFIPTDSEQLLAWFKWTNDFEQPILVIVNLDPNEKQESIIHLPLEKLGISPNSSFQVKDLMFDETYQWQGSTNFVSLSPRSKPLHILKIVR